MDKTHFVALGEEAAAGTAEVTTVGFMPVMEPCIPIPGFDEMARPEFRGEDPTQGSRDFRRYSEKWEIAPKFQLYSEAGTIVGMVGTILKHFFGKATSAPNATTGQHLHHLIPRSDPFHADNLAAKALTLITALTEGTALKSWIWDGGRVKSLTFEIIPGKEVTLTVEMMGREKNATAANTMTVVMPAENLLYTGENVTIYQGALDACARTGTKPDFTEYAKGTMVQFKPDKITLKLENGMEDKMRISGVATPDKTEMGQFKASLDITMNWEDPTTGLSAVDDYESWLSGEGSTSFLIIMDTGTQAGTGDTHSLKIDLPAMQRVFTSPPNFSKDKDPTIDLHYEGLKEQTTCEYMVAMLMKNTASAL